VRIDPVIARVAAANPCPATATRSRAPLGWRPQRRALPAALAAAVVVVPTIAFAGGIGGLLGFSTEGQPVAASATPFSKVSGLGEATSELGFPSTLQLIATRDGISFYAARRADGHVCVAVDAAPGANGHKGVGCDLGDPSLPAKPAFPSPERPIIDFSRFSGGARLMGVAADGVASVDLLDAAGNVIDSAPVIDNVYADANPPAGAAAVEALDSRGAVIVERRFDEAP
jgi:hypothetical protein